MEPLSRCFHRYHRYHRYHRHHPYPPRRRHCLLSPHRLSHSFPLPPRHPTHCLPSLLGSRFLRYPHQSHHCSRFRHLQCRRHPHPPRVHLCPWLHRTLLCHLFLAPRSHRYRGSPRCPDYHRRRVCLPSHRYHRWKRIGPWSHPTNRTGQHRTGGLRWCAPNRSTTASRKPRVHKTVRVSR